MLQNSLRYVYFIKMAISLVNKVFHQKPKRHTKGPKQGQKRSLSRANGTTQPKTGMHTLTQAQVYPKTIMQSDPKSQQEVHQNKNGLNKISIRA